MSATDEIGDGPEQRGAGNEQRVSLGMSGKPPAEDKLMAYLEGKLLPEEQRDIEQWLSEEGMESDAVDGLQSLPADDTQRTIKRLNQDLERTIKLKTRKRRQAKPDQTILVAVFIVLLLSVAAYVVIKYAVHK